MMRLKKSSSGTVGPRTGGGGGAHRWSSKRDPWQGYRKEESVGLRSDYGHSNFLCIKCTACCTIFLQIISGTWHLTSMSKKSSSGSALSALAIRWLSTAWLLFWLSLRPGKLPPAADDSSNRRPWAPETLADSDKATKSLSVSARRDKQQKVLFQYEKLGTVGPLCDCMDLHFLMALGGDSGPLFNDNLLPLSCIEQRWSSIRLLWKRLSRSKNPSSPSMSGLSR